jgi:hypothetical protein
MHMKWPTPLLLVLFLSTFAGRAPGQPSSEYSLVQNDPNPFCESTTIGFSLPVAAQVLLAVWDPDSTHVVRTLLQGYVAPGTHQVLWDGRDDQGAILENGSFPYVLTVTEVPGEPAAFVASLRAIIDCPSPVRVRTWGVARALYRDPPR